MIFFGNKLTFSEKCDNLTILNYISPKLFGNALCMSLRHMGWSIPIYFKPEHSDSYTLNDRKCSGITAEAEESFFGIGSHYVVLDIFIF